MAVNRKIEWSISAEEQLSVFYHQLLASFGLQEAEHFLDLVQAFERVIYHYPKAFVQSKKKKNVRIGFIHKHISAIYEVKKDTLIILALIDNRSHKSNVR